MSEYDVKWLRGVLKYVCNISFLIVVTGIAVVVFFDDVNSSVIDTIMAVFLVSGVIAGWILVTIDFLFVSRGNQDD